MKGLQLQNRVHVKALAVFGGKYAIINEASATENMKLVHTIME